MVKSHKNADTTAGEGTMEKTFTGKIAKKTVKVPKKILAKTGKHLLKGTEHLVMDTVDFATDLTRWGSTQEIPEDPFALDNKMDDEFGTGNVKIFLKNQYKIPSAFARLAKNDPSLVELTFRFIELNWKEISLLSLAIRANSCLQKLTFYKSDINDGNAKELAKGIRENSGIQELVFYQNRLTVKGSCSLCEAMGANKTVNSFGFFKNNLGMEGMEIIRQAVNENSNIHTINLFKNEVGEEGAKTMATIIKNNPSFISLSISHNNIGNAGVNLIAEALDKHPYLTNLALSGNDIGKDGAMVLAKALQNFSTIQKLDLNGNDMTNDGCLAIVQELVSQKIPILELDLSYNNISESGALSMIKLLDYNTTLIDLKLKENEMKNEVIGKQIKKLIQRNQIIADHRTGVENFGPFYYVQVANAADKEHDDIKLMWTPRAWQAAESCGITIGMLHENLLKLTDLSSLGRDAAAVETSDDTVEDDSQNHDDLRTNFIKSLSMKQMETDDNSIEVDFMKSNKMGKVDDECETLDISITSQDANALSNSVLRSLYDAEVVRQLFDDCKDNDGNTLLTVAKRNKSEEGYNFVRVVSQALSAGGTFVNDGDLDQTSQCGATIANTIDDTDQWGENSKIILGRYHVENYPDRPMYKSDKSSVFSAVDILVDSFNEYRQVALKLVDQKEDFEKELNHRLGSRDEIENGKDLIYKDEQNNLHDKNKFDDEYIMPIIRFHEEELCLVMPLGDRNLDEIIRNEAVAGIAVDQIRSLMKSIAMSMHHLHKEHKMIHGDIKPRNFVRYKGEMKMIDFHQATPLNDHFDSKRSTGYIAPELAHGIFMPTDSKQLAHWAKEEKKIMKKLLKLDRTDEQHQEVIQLWEKKFEEIRPHIRRSSFTATMNTLESENVHMASVVLDIWSFGVLAFYLLAGSQLFACDQNDNIYMSDIFEQEKLLLWNGLTEVNASRIRFYPLDFLHQINAIDLLRRCLHPDRKLRFSSMTQVLNHAFFIDDGEQPSDLNNPKVANSSLDLRDTVSPVESISYKHRESLNSAISNVSAPEIDKKESIQQASISSSSSPEDLSLVELKIKKKESFIERCKRQLLCA